MKITWFGHTCFRLHYGGEILVIDPHTAPQAIDAVELHSGADHTVNFGDAVLPPLDPATFAPRRPLRAIDVDDAHAGEGPMLWSLDPHGLVLESGDEPPVIVLGGEVGTAFGPWADGAILVLADNAALAGATSALRAARLRLIVVALDGNEVDRAVEILKPQLGRAGLMVLEAGLALEV